MTVNPSKSARSIAIASILTALVGSAGIAQGPIPGLGTWTLDVANSKYSPGPTPKSGTVTFTVVGQGVKAVVDLLGPDGSKVHWEYTATLDGKPAPVTGNPDGDMVVAKRTNTNTVNTRVVSADGKTMTVTSAGTNAQGQKVNNHQVFTKS